MGALERLQPWRQALAPLTAEVATALLPWVERLSLAIGPLAQVDPEADGDPDGFAGLGRRGSYERLVPTEWLLATEAPDEFVRRAAAGEHAFFELAHRGEAGSRVSAVFFDAGPMQLGAPRLVHLALLLLLERRAQAAAARFFWGVAQQPSVLRETVTPEQGQMLLQGRSRVDLDGPLVKLLTEQKELREAGRELWLVGGPQVRALAPGPCIEILEPLEREATRLVARVRRPDRSEVEVSLPLPPADLQLRLLRDPFQRAAPPPQRRPVEAGRPGTAPRLDGQGALFFSSNGRRLFVELEGGLAAYPIANSPHAIPAGEPMLYQTPPTTTLLAACWEKNRATMLLEGSDGARHLQAVGRRGGDSGAPIPVHFAYTTLRARHPGPVCALHPTFTTSGTTSYYLREPTGALQYLRPSTGPATDPGWQARVQAHTCQVLETLNFTVIGVQRRATGDQEIGSNDPPAGLLTFATWAPDGTSTPLDIGPIEGRSVHFGHAESSHQHPQLGLCAIERPGGGDWMVFCRAGVVDVSISTPAMGTVVGVFHGGRVPTVLVLEPEGTHLVTWGPTGQTTLARTKNRIIKVAICTARSLVGYLCDDGLLVVLASAYEHPVLQVQHDAS